ncbi:MAG: DUF5703 domain-containing protein [Bacteroidota bacterium]
MRLLSFWVPLILVSSAVRGQSAVPVDTGFLRVAKYNIEWKTPSTDYNGSMPIGNGDIGINAWVDPSGGLSFYIGKSDSWGDNGRLLKVGRVDLSLVPPPDTPLVGFNQTLHLDQGVMVVQFGVPGDRTSISLWVDANHPVIHLEIKSDRPKIAVAAINLWRTKRDTLSMVEVSDIFYGRKSEHGGEALTIVEPDSLSPPRPHQIGWFHRNVKSVGPALTARIQGMEAFPRPDPLLHRVFGALISTPGAQRRDGAHLMSSSAKHHLFNIPVVTEHPASSAAWLEHAEKIVSEAEGESIDALRSAHIRWWRSFWSRSWIDVTGVDTTDAVESTDAFDVSRAYALQRYMSACAGRGRYPIKFNGSIFTVPFDHEPGDADYRRWGPGYWWQNTRLPYYSMCTSGDYDLMKPLFRMYGKDLMPLFRYRTHLFLNHDGAYIPECIYFWGDMFTETYGWTPFAERKDKLQESRWHKWEWVSGLELVWLMLEYYEHTLDPTFLAEMLLPAAHQVLTFFDQQYRLDANGKLLMHPAQSAETWWNCTNPMPEIAGLHAVLRRLQALPVQATSAKERRFWISLEGKLPELPTRELDGVRMLAPADNFADKQNIENPELYAVFPFRLVAFDTPTRELGVEAFRYRQDRGNAGWRQDDLFAAYLGLADTVKSYIVGRAKNKNVESRFPAFWGPNYDWTPDQDHGSVLLKALQAMVIQTEGRKIFLLPAWPKSWNVEFKLHAPLNTTVEGRYVRGEFKEIRVSPAGRSKDLVFLTHR